MRIAVASGKGGTGKTMVSIALAETLSLEDQQIVLLSDCDVEAPNVHIFLRPVFNQSKDVHILIPEVQKGSCTACGTCAEVCHFNAILMLQGQPQVFPSLCHGCGSCAINCPEDAILEIPNPIGIIEFGAGKEELQLRQGKLNPGEPIPVPIITALKTWDVGISPGLEIIDSPPGASCSVVESIRGADFLVLVTEPTPFGLHDLKQACQLAEGMGIPTGVIVNRAGIGETDIEGYCRGKGIPLLMTIPLDREIGVGLARGDSLLDIKPEYGVKFIDLFSRISRICKAGEGLWVN